MGISEGYKRVADHHKKVWSDFEDRCKKLSLGQPSKDDFTDGVQPITRNGWRIFEQLLAAEGQLSEDVVLKIQRGLELINIKEKVEEIQQRLRMGYNLDNPFWLKGRKISPNIALSVGARPLVTWVAIKELGLDGDVHYQYHLKQAEISIYKLLKSDKSP